MSTKTNTTVPSPQAIAGFKKKADKLVELQKDHDSLANELEERLKPIREDFEPDIQKVSADIRKLESELHDFADEHFDTLFADGSEIRTKVSVITGKVTPGKVTVMDGFDEKDVIESCYTDRGLKKFIAITKRLDRTGIKKVLAGATSAAREKLADAGLCIESGISLKVKGKGD